LTLNEYLELHTKSHLTLVGPLLDKPHTFSADPLIFVDGGARFRKEKEGFSVGDGDSYPLPLDETISARKDYSDLSYVLNLASAYNKVEAWGFWGGRKDHEMANIGEFHQFLKKLQRAEVKIPPQARGFSAGEWTLTINGLFSLFVAEKSEVQITGEAEYSVPTPRVFEPFSSLGLSNNGRGEIRIRSSNPFFLFYKF